MILRLGKISTVSSESSLGFCEKVSDYIHLNSPKCRQLSASVLPPEGQLREQWLPHDIPDSLNPRFVVRGCWNEQGTRAPALAIARFDTLQAQYWKF